jgi:hypothetical protein
MASEILGLFGKTPAQIRQEQFDSMMVSPTQMGSQGLLQQVVSMGRNAGSAAGGMAGRMMGGMAPGEREAMVMQDVMQRVGQDPNMTQAERLRKMAEIVSQQPGMGDQALKLQAAANQLETQQMTIDEAKFKQANRFEDRKETRMVPDGLGGVVPKQFYWTEKYNEQTGKWEKMTAPSETPPPAAGGGDGKLSAQAQAKAQLDKLNATPSATPADNTLGGVIDAVEAKADMAPLNREADIERAGYNSAAAQVAQQDQKIKKMSDVERLTPTLIGKIEASDARRIFKDHFELLSDEQKRELRKRIASGRRRGYGHFKQAPPAER